MTQVRVQLIKRSRKLPSGKTARYWMLRWFGSNGKPQHESLGRVDQVKAKDAKAVRDQKMQDINGGVLLRDRPKRMTLGQYLERDRETIKGDVRGSTLLEHRHASQHAIAALGEDIELTKIDFTEVGRIKSYLQDKGRSPATVKKTLGTLRAAFNRAAKQKLIHSNPFADLRMPKVESKQKRTFTPAEADAMIAATDDLWWKVLIRTAITSGLRKDELLNLQWADIDEDAETIKVQPKSAETVTVGQRTYSTWAWWAKARSSYRTIPVSSETIKALQRLKIKQGGSPYVFIDLHRLNQMQRHIENGKLPPKFDIRPYMLRDFQRIQRKAEAKMNETRPTDQPIRWKLGTLHDLRRSFCTIMANHVPMHVLRAWAGHSDISTTADFYLGMTDGQDDRGRQAIMLAAG